MSPVAIPRAVRRHQEWRRVGDRLVLEIAMRDFDDALRLVERIAQAAVDYHRRPAMCISELNRVRLTISNLHHAGITEAELRLAAKVSAVIDDDRRRPAASTGLAAEMRANCYVRSRLLRAARSIDDGSGAASSGSRSRSVA